MKNIVYLDGLWGIRSDKTREGIEKQFYNEDFEESVLLPAVLSDDCRCRRHGGCPAAEGGFVWFQRRVVLKSISEKNVRLFLERTGKNMVWVNGIFAGERKKASPAPYVCEVGKLLREGENVITVLSECYDGFKRCGITGEISLRSYAEKHIECLQVFPDTENSLARLRFRLCGCDSAEISVYASFGRDFCRAVTYTVCADREGFAELTYPFGDKMRLWSENDPNLCNLTIELANGDEETVTFGMRKLSDENGFKINGRPLYLRCKSDGLLHTLTDADDGIKDWEKLFRTAKKHGVNSFFFEKSFPPEAAFDAADKTGIYICAGPEDGEDCDELVSAFGNHPSFCLIPVENTAEDKRQIYCENPFSLIAPHDITVMQGNQGRFYKSYFHYSLERYKKELESAQISGGNGFCLPDIKDFPWRNPCPENPFDGYGQSGVVTSYQQWHGFCAEKVLVAAAESFVVTNGKFESDIFACCCTDKGFSDDYIHWEISSDGHVLTGGDIAAQRITGVQLAGRISALIPEYAEPQRLVLTLAAKSTENSYDLWVFPETDMPESTEKLLITGNTADALRELKKGNTVLLLSDSLKSAVTADKSRILIDCSDDSLEKFPCRSWHTPQWEGIFGGNTVAVDCLHEKVRTIVSAEKDRRYTILGETEICGGKLLFCTVPLDRLAETVEGRWFVRSLAGYCESDNFSTASELEESDFASIFV